ncbi:hypothetical protein [Longispora albida]|uniref:hypothetical protein n=1 Tax=Longispora albida TaxID=203523 RepID=UPI0003684066|nr:hypothetical protein [Longispora albida]
MTTEELLRGWKDPELRTGWHPAGEISLAELSIAGPHTSTNPTYGCTTLMAGLGEDGPAR